jgi:6-phosphogluconolactonase (cycloisomerase 2 family)
LGDFSVSSSIGTPQVEIAAQGFYTDELSGQLSASQITLHAIVDLSVSTAATVNVLTTLQEPRLKALVSQGQSFSAAYTQSETEVLAIFEIDSSKVNSLSQLSAMRIDQGSDSDAVLLAASAVLSQIASDTAKANGTTQAAELSNLINTLAAQLANSGKVTSSTFTAARDLAEAEINVSTVSANLQGYYEKNGANVTVPTFQEWLDPSNSGLLPQRLVPVSGLAFMNDTGAIPGQEITSNSITISGIPSGVVVPVTVSNAVLIKNGVALTGSLAIVTDGDVIALRTTALGYSSSAQVSITVGSSSVVWDVATEALTGTISGLTGSGLTLQVNGGNNVAVSAGSTSFSFPTAIATGATYTVTVGQQPMAPPLQVCEVLNGSGTVGVAAAAVSIVCGSPTEELIVSDDQGNVAAFLVGPTAGALGSVTAPVALPAGFTAVAGDPKGSFLFALNPAAENISSFTISAATGGLIPVPGSPFNTGPYGQRLSHLIVDSSGRFLFGSIGSAVLAFTIDRSSGSVSLVSGSPFGSSAQIVDCYYTVVCVASGSFLYYQGFVGAGSFSVAGFAINSTTGALTPLGAIDVGGCCGPSNAVIDPNNRFYLQATGYLVESYSIDASSGALTLISTEQAPVGVEMTFVAVHPSGRFAYAVSSTQLLLYSIDTTSGVLAPIAPAAPIMGGFWQIAFDLLGKYMYVSSPSGIYVFAVDATTGLLAPVPGSPFPVTVTPNLIVPMRVP